MNKTLNIEIYISPDDECDVDYLKDIISDAICENENSFFPITTTLCEEKDLRATYLDGSLCVECIDFKNPDIFDTEGNILDDIDGIANVSFEYDAYYGCKDMDNGGEVEDSWSFKLSKGKVIFSFEMPEVRHDEI
ncbi:hypothetical protein [Aeromonas caviae]|uniref:hypothetical protein n=1 Tax=Aeromonas caviae TaxID=648 RepID=UPI0031373445